MHRRERMARMLALIFGIILPLAVLGHRVAQGASFLSG